MSDDNDTSAPPPKRATAARPRFEKAALEARRTGVGDGPGDPWDLRFFKLYGLDFETEPGDRPKRRLVLDRGDSVAVLPFDRRRGEVVLVMQERAPLLLRDDAPADGQLIETVAGRLEAATDADGAAGARLFEPHSACAARELAEETAIVLDADSPRLFPRRSDDPAGDEAFHAARVGVYVSPGGSTEAIWLFLADITGLDAARVATAGEPGADERTQIVRTPLRRFVRDAERGVYRDAKTVVAAQMLKRLVLQPSDGDEAQGAAFRRRLKGGDREIAVLPGSLMRWPGAMDAVVCPVGRDLAMDPMSRRTLSASLRRCGAHFADPRWPIARAEAAADPLSAPRSGPIDEIDPPFDPRDGLRVDAVAEALSRAGARMAARLGRPPLPGDVLIAAPGALEARLGLRAIAHLVVEDPGAPPTPAQLHGALKAITAQRSDLRRVALPPPGDAALSDGDEFAKNLAAFCALFKGPPDGVRQILVLALVRGAAEMAAESLAALPDWIVAE